MDKKTKGYDFKNYTENIKEAGIYEVPSISVEWGATSLIDAELNLLKAATLRAHYDYYHLISGEDLPIKTQDYIHNFFTANKEKEFVGFQDKKFLFPERVRYYYPFQKNLRHRFSVQRIINCLSCVIQKTLHIHRNKDIEFQKGTAWFSITDNLARYVVNKEKYVKKVFNHTFLTDEVFLQTLVHNSEFKNNLYVEAGDANPAARMRLIDWNRVKPYTFKSQDFLEIKTSNMLFARKFNCEVDLEIIDKIVSLLST